MNKIYEIPEEHVGNKRKEYISNDKACMLTACVWSLRSKDPSTGVGACFVNQEGRIISIGYNGTPNGWDDNTFPWGKPDDMKYSKYSYVVHAEKNAIANHNGRISDFKDATLFVTLFPCNECAKDLVQFGIKKVIYLSDKYKDSDSTKAAKKTFEECGIKYVSFKEIDEEYYEELRKLLVLDKEEVKKIEYIKK